MTESTMANADYDAPHWYDDPDELVAFVRWYLDGSAETWRAAVDIFDRPWLLNDEYATWKEESK